MNSILFVSFSDLENVEQVRIFLTMRKLCPNVRQPCCSWNWSLGVKSKDLVCELIATFCSMVCLALPPVDPELSKTESVYSFSLFIYPFLPSLIYSFVYQSTFFLMLSIHLLIYPFIHSFIYPFLPSLIYSFVYQSTFFLSLSIHLLIYPFIHLFIYRSFYPFVILLVVLNIF